MLRKNVASQFLHIAGVNTSTGAIVTGATWTMRRCLDGTFAAGGATITEDGTTGFYKVALAQADTNANDLGFFFTATNCVPVTLNVLATAADPSDAVRLGLTSLPNVAAGANGGLPLGDASGRVDIGKLLGTAWLAPGTAGTPDVNVKLWNALATVALPLVPTTAGRTLDVTAANKVNGVVLVDTLTTYTGNTPQTGDNFARLGAPAGASVSADVAAVKVDTAAVKTKTDFLPSAAAGAAGGVFIAGSNAATSITTALTANVIGNVTGNLSGSVGSVTGAVGSVTGLTAATVHSDLDDIQARLPAALVGGRIDASIGALAANVITATSIAADAITDAKVASDVTIASVTGAVGSVTGAVGSVTGSVGSVAAGGIAATSFAAGAIDNAAIAADAIGSSELAASAVAEIADQVWDELLSGHAVSGSTGEALSAAGASGDPWITTLPGAYSAGQAGYILGTNLDATVGTRATQTSVNTIDDFLDTEVAAIQAKTDLIPAIPAAVGDIPTALQNADALLNRDMSAVSDTNARSPLNALRFIRNKWTIVATTLSVKKEDDATEAWNAAVTATPGADPVTGSDPA